MKRRRALTISPPCSSGYGTFLLFGSVSSTSAGGECSLSRGYPIAVESLPRLPHTSAATCVHEVRGLLMGPQGTLHGHDNALLCLPLYFFISTGLCWLTTVCCPTREHVLYLTAANRQRSAQRRFPMHLAPEFPESPDARGTMGANGRNRAKGACVCGKAWPTRPNAFVVWICPRQKWIRTGAAGHEFRRGPQPRIGAAEVM